jgi:hypothetical protein
MRIASHRSFPHNIVNERALQMVRATAAVLAVVLLGNSVAFAAGTAPDPVKLKQKLATHGIGKSVRVTELDGTTINGNIVAIRDDDFDLTVKKTAQPVTIAYSRVARIDNPLSTGAKIGIIVGIVVVIAAVVAIVAASKVKGISGLGSGPI